MDQDMPLPDPMSSAASSFTRHSASPATSRDRGRGSREGSPDALFSGVIGLSINTGIFAELYPSQNRRIRSWKPVEKKTVPELLGIPELIAVAG